MHVDYLPRQLPEHKWEKDLMGITRRQRAPHQGRDALSMIDRPALGVEPALGGHV